AAAAAATPSRDTPPPRRTERVRLPELGRLVIKLRPQTQGKPTHSGLAARSWTRKRGSALALGHAGGEHHNARGVTAPNRAQSAERHTPRRGPKDTTKRQLEQQHYRDKRERERERDESALLTHLPTGPSRHAKTPGTPVPNDLTRTQPLLITIRPSPTNPHQ